MTDTDHADDLPIKPPAQAESQWHSLEQAAGSIGLYVNANKTEYLYFIHKDTISTLNGKPLKLVDQFIYLGSYFSSIESGQYMLNKRVECH